MNPDFFMLFIPTIAAVSLVPGMCMMLAFTLGMSLGYGRTLWMMAGELMGVATVVSASLWLLQKVLMLTFVVQGAHAGGRGVSLLGGLPAVAD